MAESPSRRAGGLLVCTLLALLPLSAGAEEGAPLADFRRVELRVSADFIADCQTRSTQITCKVNEVPREFSQLMFGLRGGTLAGVELLPKPDGTAQVRFSLKRTELRFQDGMLDGPRRWVIEIGLPAILIAPVQEQLPFRPYRVRTADLGLALPPANVQPLPMRGEPERRYQTCYAAFVEQRYDDAVEQCARVDPEHADSSAARMARKITAEAWVERASPNSTDDLPAISQALAAAESDATDPVEKVRYALLAAQVLEKLGYLNRAELHLDTRRPAYEGTPAEPYLLAGRARMLMMVGDFESARRLLEQLRALPGTSPTIGSALIALAGIAYEEG
ncbi:MAG: hypothetical protein KDG44_00915, partial [Burkholderiaceae bacterium]|nr:hypothetical protein [Burkholderiaceae bacterium]